MTVEVFSDGVDMSYADAIRALDGVEDLTLIQYNGEYHGSMFRRFNKRRTTRALREHLIMFRRSDERRTARRCARIFRAICRSNLRSRT